ncbi:MAG: hypothetical protein RSD92_07245 [Erysipelotrichaceae bacterium]
MKKLLILAAFAAFASCSDNDNSSPEENNNQIPTPDLKGKLKMMEGKYFIYEDDVRKDYVLKVENFYGANGYISQTKTTDTYDNSVSFRYYYYSGNNIVKMRYELEGKNYETSYSYKNDLIVKSTNNEEQGLHIKNYDYNSIDEKIKETYFRKTSTLNSITDYTYSNGNIIKEVINYKEDGFPIEPLVNTYSYDSKNTPGKGGFPDNYLMLVGGGKNNMIKHNNLVYTYEYNADNYPTKRFSEYAVTTYYYY